MQAEEWWVDVTLPMLETARRRLRLLVPFIEKRKRKFVYIDFEDELGAETPVAFQGLSQGDGFERFRRKARAFLLEQTGQSAVGKIKHNMPLTTDDIAELQRVLIDSGIATAADIERAAAEADGSGLFVRQLIGLERAAAKEAFAESSTTGASGPARSSSPTLSSTISARTVCRGAPVLCLAPH